MYFNFFSMLPEIRTAGKGKGSHIKSLRDEEGKTKLISFFHYMMIRTSTHDSHFPPFFLRLEASRSYFK